MTTRIRLWGVKPKPVADGRWGSWRRRTFRDAAMFDWDQARRGDAYLAMRQRRHYGKAHAGTYLRRARLTPTLRRRWQAWVRAHTQRAP
jgi:hypothetical protein